MGMSYQIAAFYHFADFPDYKDWQAKLYAVMKPYNMRGTILLADEGINGTVCGDKQAVQKLLDFIRQDERFRTLAVKYSESENHSFSRLKVRLKKEIVSLGQDGVKPAHDTGTHVAPEKWNALISRDDVLVIDTRNIYEVEIGTFNNAISPQTTNFRQFPDYVQQSLTDDDKNRPIAMFCTGGIRCEKASAYMKQQGFQEVYQLDGGILQYLENVPKEESLWQGECFVFDQRVTVDHDLQEGNHLQCYACRMPLKPDEAEHPHYQKGLSCHHCYGTKSEKKQQGLLMREKQIALSMKRGAKERGERACAIERKNNGCVT